MRKVRDVFTKRVHETGHGEDTADYSLLCMHQAVEGARVGVNDYMFRSGPDVIKGTDIPDSFSAVLSGHIHRAQTLTTDLKGSLLGAPVFYPGSIERTSFAERLEEKGYMIIELGTSMFPNGRDIQASFVALPTRNMVNVEFERGDSREDEFLESVKTTLHKLDPHAVVRICLKNTENNSSILNAERLRKLAPCTMNTYLSLG